MVAIIRVKYVMVG